MAGLVLLLLATAGGPSAAAPQPVPTGVRLLMVGLDGADWQIAGPLIEAGRMPHLARLKERGAWGDLRSATPTLSPLLWTSIATGKTPGEHGIIDFLVRDPRTGQKVPITSTFRKTKALWNIYSDAGRRTDFIAWWATWPAETINGRMISDRLAYSLFGYSERPEDRVGVVSPASFYDEIEPLRVPESRITLADLRRFAPITTSDLEAARAKVKADETTAYSDPINHLIRILASTRTYHAIALKLAKEGRSDLLGVYYQGIDEVCHRFAQYIPPRLSWIDTSAYEKYGNVVTRFYEYQDELLGELLRAAGPNVSVIVVSDHGFVNGSDRPEFPPDIELKAALWHRLYGMVVMQGPGIAPGRLEPVGLYDITPTLLYLSGLPVPGDLAGRPILDAIEPAFRQKYRLATIPSYEDPNGRDGSGSLPGSSAEINEEILARLRSLGYVAASDISTTPGGEAEAPATLNNMFNLATLKFGEGDLDGAETPVREILSRSADHVPAHSLLSEILEARGLLEEAQREARTALNLTPEPSERLVERFARLARRLGTLAEAKSYFLRYAQQRARLGEPWLGLGLAQAMSGDLKSAEASFLRALDINPRSTSAATWLYNLYERGERSGEIRATLEKAVSINPDSATHRTLLGMIDMREGRGQSAERHLRRALELEPERDLTLAALADLLAATNRAREGQRLLERAIGRDGERPEVRMSLARIYAKMGRMGEATRQMSEAARVDPSSASAHAQLGMLYMMQEQPERAIVEASRALDLDPDLYDVRMHLAVLYHDVGRLAECERELKEAIARRPRDPEPYRLLAGLYDEQGRVEEAREVRDRIDSSAPGRQPR